MGGKSWDTRLRSLTFSLLDLAGRLHRHHCPLVGLFLVMFGDQVPSASVVPICFLSRGTRASLLPLHLNPAGRAAPSGLRLALQGRGQAPHPLGSHSLICTHPRWHRLHTLLFPGSQLPASLFLWLCSPCRKDSAQSYFGRDMRLLFWNSLGVRRGGS